MGNTPSGPESHKALGSPKPRQRPHTSDASEAMQSRQGSSRPHDQAHKPRADGHPTDLAAKAIPRRNQLPSTTSSPPARDLWTPSDRGSSTTQRKDQLCQVCRKKSPREPESLVSCSICRRRYHKGCHKPEIQSPSETWKCNRCSGKETQKRKPNQLESSDIDLSSRKKPRTEVQPTNGVTNNRKHVPNEMPKTSEEGTSISRHADRGTPLQQSGPPSRQRASKEYNKSSSPTFSMKRTRDDWRSLRDDPEENSRCRSSAPLLKTVRSDDRVEQAVELYEAAETPRFQDHHARGFPSRSTTHTAPRSSGPSALRPVDLGASAISLQLGPTDLTVTGGLGTTRKRTNTTGESIKGIGVENGQCTRDANSGHRTGQASRHSQNDDLASKQHSDRAPIFSPVIPKKAAMRMSNLGRSSPSTTMTGSSSPSHRAGHIGVATPGQSAEASRTLVSGATSRVPRHQAEKAPSLETKAGDIPVPAPTCPSYRSDDAIEDMDVHQKSGDIPHQTTDFSGQTPQVQGPVDVNHLEAALAAEDRGMLPPLDWRKLRFTRDLKDSVVHNWNQTHGAQAEKDRQAKLKEIKARPRRKQIFGNTGLSRLARNGWVDKMKTIKLGRNQDFAQRTAKSPNEVDGSKISGMPPELEVFDSVEELLDLPQRVIPMIHEHHLAFRDLTPSASRKAGRPRIIYKVGQNARVS